MIKHYYSLTKPGIIYGNAFTTAGGFLLASKGTPDFFLFISTLAGISLVIASACVFNNYIDRDIDAMMERTRNRALVRGVISPSAALLYGAILGICGLALLALSNWITVAVATFGVFAYIFLYSLWAKRYTVHATLIGALSGAVPPIVGYTAVSGHIDLGAILLFIILSIWQLPHAFAIAIYRYDDYVAAAIPVLPIHIGMRLTKIYMALSVAAFIATSLSLTFFGYTGYLYAIVMAILGGAWFALSIYGLTNDDDTKWGRKMFLFSLIIILAFCLLIALDSART